MMQVGAEHSSYGVELRALSWACLTVVGAHLHLRVKEGVRFGVRNLNLLWCPLYAHSAVSILDVHVEKHDRVISVGRSVRVLQVQCLEE